MGYWRFCMAFSNPPGWFKDCFHPSTLLFGARLTNSLNCSSVNSYGGAVG